MLLNLRHLRNLRNLRMSSSLIPDTLVSPRRLHPWLIHRMGFE